MPAPISANRPWPQRLHLALLWLAGPAVLLWVLSGLLHPLMGLLGPMPARFAAPAPQIDAQPLVAGLPRLMSELGDARVARVVPGPNAPLWQLSDEHGRRRYLQLDGQTSVLDDGAYANWLANAYTGLQALRAPPVLLTDFDADYPSVNRLLPVWRLDYDTPGEHSAYVHTETGALTSYTDTRKRALQTAFRQVHTLAFLDGVEPLRVGLLSLLMLATLTIAASGLVLVWRRRGTRPPPLRRWHRRLALIAVLPLLLMAMSGLLHVLLSGGPPAQPWLAAAPGALGEVAERVRADEAALLRTLPAQLEAAALRSGPQGQPWLVLRTKSDSAAPAPLIGIALDEAVPVQLSAHALGAGAALAHLGTAVPGALRFGFDPDYDFRNRRLPVWSVIEPSSGDALSFDPLTGQRVERAPARLKFEAWTFSWLHKWNPLSGPLGRFGRDGLQAAWLLLAVVVAALGLLIHLRRPRPRPPASSKSPPP